MASIPSAAEHLWTSLTLCAERCARTSGCIQRQRVFSGAQLVQTLVLGFWQHPRATLHQLTQVAVQLGAAVSPQGLDQRFTATLVSCLSQVLGTVSAEVARREPGVSALLERFNGVYMLDATTISLPAPLAEEFPGCGGGNGGGEAAIKVTVLLEVGSGTLAGLERSAGRAQDRGVTLQDAPLPAGSLRVQDLGFFTLAVLRRIDAQGGQWLSRLRMQTVLRTPDGERITELGTWLRRQAVAGIVDTWLQIGAQERLPARLLAVRVPQAVADGRRRALRATARKKGQAPSRAALALADWTLLVTNVPEEQLTPDEALVLARARWQVELLFKSWKDQSQLDSSSSAKPQRVLAELYAKLIAITLQHWILGAVGFRGPEQSLVKAVQIIRDQVIRLIVCMRRSPRALRPVLHDIARGLRAGCHVDRRATRPALAQLLDNPALTRTRGLMPMGDLTPGPSPVRRGEIGDWIYWGIRKEREAYQQR